MILVVLKRLSDYNEHMLYKRILRNIVLLIQGKIKAQEIPAKIGDFVFSLSKSFRKIKKSRFSIDKVIFRHIEPNDKSRYIEFICKYFKDNSLERKTISIPVCNAQFLYYVALYKDKIVGDAGLTKIPSSQTNLWQIGGVSILPELRGYGIGERILKVIISQIKENNYIIFVSVSKYNERAIKLYKKLGFRLADKRQMHQIYNIPSSVETLLMVLKNSGRVF
jgi:RimJ/RimL family protein N-acetyltransferase